MTTTDDVRQALRTATDELVAPPELLAHAHAGGRRRIRRRRALVAGVAVLVAAALVLPQWRDGEQEITVAGSVGERLLRQPTRGDLAGNEEFVRAATTAWNTSHGQSANAAKGYFDDLRGTPHVVWAGTTPSGWAAVVLQRAVIHDREELRGEDTGPDVVAGVFEAAGSKLKRLGDGREHGFFPLAFLTGFDQQTLIAVDTGTPQEYTVHRNYHSDGRLDRTWTPMRLRDGVYRANLHPGERTSELAVRDVGAGMRFNEVAQLSWDRDVDGRNLGWTATLAAGSTEGWPPPSNETVFQPLQSAISANNHDDSPGAVTLGAWNAYGTAPDGTRFIVGEQADGYADPSHLYGLLLTPGKPQLFNAGPVDPRATLPVAVVLPGDRGTVVARVGATLRWRTASGPWSAPAVSAAQVPPGATHVEVTPQGSAPQVVPLRP